MPRCTAIHTYNSEKTKDALLKQGAGNSAIERLGKKYDICEISMFCNMDLNRRLFLLALASANRSRHS